MYIHLLATTTYKQVSVLCLCLMIQIIPIFIKLYEYELFERKYVCTYINIGEFPVESGVAQRHLADFHWRVLCIHILCFHCGI